MSFDMDPIRRYVLRSNGGAELAELKKAVAAGVGVGNNQLFVAAVTGKCIGVMGWIVSANVAASMTSVIFKDGSGGANLAIAIGNSALETDNKLPIKDVVYFKTTAGVALVVDVQTTAANIQVFYVEC